MPGLNLTRTEASNRAETVQPHDYAVQLDLTKGDRVFLSTTTISFSAVPGAETFLDLVAQKVHSITLNGKPVAASAYEDNRIRLTGLAESNRVTVEADCLYMHTGEGLHSFVDPADGLRYCYSQFEVPDARRVFATFEQPDLKASFAFSVTVPEGWTVLSNEATSQPVPTLGGLRFDFQPTPVISTYITAIIAGPYVGKTSALTSTDGRTIPLGVYCRRSLAEHLDADQILDVTRRGFRFFEEAYQIPYPFQKYDQVFVPEYNAGAMENAGCVTYRDQYLFRSRPTAWQLEDRANTILHELAHMWFGNLVTMEWWNDLWLNESFAEYMSHLALAEATEWTDAWIGFTSRKEWGLSQDQLPSTHPIKAEIRDLQDVEVNFDGITYAKGASVLRQLVSYVGQENFFRGLNSYLTKNAWGNATLEDLLTELEAASGRDLRHWSVVWLEEAGVTLLRPSFETDDQGRFTSVSIVQEPFTPTASLRPHRLAIAGYGPDRAGDVRRDFVYEADVEGPVTPVPQLTGVARPALLLVNDGDLAYAKIRLDEQSVAFAQDHIHRLEDPLARRTVLSAAWDMVRDGDMPATDFLALANRLIPAEQNISTLTSALARVSIATNRFTAPQHRDELQRLVAKNLSDFAQAAPPSSDQQRLLVGAFARAAVTPEQFRLVGAIRADGADLPGLVLDVDLQWTLLISLVRGGLAGEEEILAQRASDPTLTGEQRTQQALATIDSARVRQSTWEEALGNSEIPNDTVWAMLAGFWSHAATSPSLYTGFATDFFERAVPIWRSRTFHMASRLIEEAFPTSLAGYVPGLDVPGLAQRWLDENPGEPDSLRRLIGEGQADAQRMLVAQATDQRAASLE